MQSFVNRPGVRRLTPITISRAVIASSDILRFSMKEISSQTLRLSAIAAALLMGSTLPGVSAVAAEAAALPVVTAAPTVKRRPIPARDRILAWGRGLKF
jgi:hypothetical protein